MSALGARALQIHIALALLAKTFKHEDIAIMRSAAKKARVPEQLILFAEKIASCGVAAEKG